MNPLYPERFNPEVSEAQRVKALRDLGILDTDPEAIFDQITALAAATFDVPISLVSLIDTHRQWFKSRFGLEATETPREIAFCDVAIRDSSVLVVSDAELDARFNRNPLVTGEPGIRFYAGAPLLLEPGVTLGTLCIIDRQPRSSFGDREKNVLAAMAATVCEAIRMRRDLAALDALHREQHEREQISRQVEAAAGVGRWSWDCVSNQTIWSPAVYKIHGVDPSLAPPAYEQVLELYHPEDRALLGDAVSEALKSGLPYLLQARIIRPADGEVRHIRASGEASCLADGSVSRLSGVIVDVTDEVLASQAAEAASQIKSAFLANMSHEIRTPLTAILGYTSILRGGPLDAASADSVSRIERAGQSLLAIVNDILDFSKLEAGQMTIKPRPIPLGETCLDCVSIFEGQAAAKGLEIKVEGIDTLSWAVVDPDRLRQLLINLIGNAVKFTDAGAVTVRLAHEGEVLRVAVEDTGPGLSAEDQQRLFKRFTQVDGAPTRQQGGTGLGLAISKALVDAMGGRIGVESAPGIGSTFWFELPAPLCESEASTAEDLDIGNTEGVRVLVVDDNRVNRELVRTLLETFGVDVSEASDGDEAVQLAACESFDLILMDLRMPRMGGASATLSIRRSGGPNRDVPILAFTADYDIERLGVEATQGFDGCVGKPINAMDLLTKIAQLTSRPGGAAAARPASAAA